RRRGGGCRRRLPRGAGGPPVRGVLHDEAWRIGHGAVHQPLDHGQAPGTTLGDGEPGPRRHVPLRPAGDAMSSATVTPATSTAAELPKAAKKPLTAPRISTRPSFGPRKMSRTRSGLSRRSAPP